MEDREMIVDKELSERAARLRYDVKRYANENSLHEYLLTQENGIEINGDLEGVNELLDLQEETIKREGKPFEIGLPPGMTINAYAAAEMIRLADDRERAVKRSVEFLNGLNAAITAGTIPDFMMPNGKRFGDCTHRELEEFGIYRDTVERAFDADVTEGLYVFEGEMYFGVKGTPEIYTVPRGKLVAAFETYGGASPIPSAVQEKIAEGQGEWSSAQWVKVEAKHKVSLSLKD
jgi:hypothetical protein